MSSPALGAEFDVGTAVLLAAVVALEGIRRVPPGALVLRASPGHGFQPVSDQPGVQWVSRFPPLTSSLLLQPGEASQRPVDRTTVGVRLTATRLVRQPLTLLCTVQLFGLVVGVPLALALAGTPGFLAAAGLLLLLSLQIWVLTATGLGALGLTRGSALRRAAPLLSPFAAPRAVELLLEEATRGASPLVAAAELLQPSVLFSWLRPRLYDALQDSTNQVDLAAVIPPSVWQARLAEPPDEERDQAAAFCPRCGASYREVVPECADCGVSLIRGSGADG